MNHALANHPRMAQSVTTLLEWGVTVLESQAEGPLLVMASIEAIVDSVKDVVG
jgi:hypothetical protein